MSFGTVAFAGKLTTVDTTPSYPLGYTVVVPAKGDGLGNQVWIYVKSEDVIVQGSVVSRKAGESTYIGILAPIDSTISRVIGVAQHAIASGSYGFILREGVGEVLADAGGVTADLGLMLGDAAGTADAASAVTTDSFGVATETVASGLATCRICCRG